MSYIVKLTSQRSPTRRHSIPTAVHSAKAGKVAAVSQYSRVPGTTNGKSSKSLTLPHVRHNDGVDGESVFLSPTSQCFDDLFQLTEKPTESFASQLTLVDLPLFKAISRKELSSCAWTSKQKHELAPNIVACTQRFNQTSFWVVKEVLSCSQLKARVEMLAYFIHLAQKLLDFNNLNSVVAVISALQTASVYRLSKTWAELSKKDRATYDKIAALISGDDNWCNLRKWLENAELPCIPHLGLFLTDITYMSCASTKSKEKGIRAKLEAILDSVEHFQASSYDDFDVLPEIQLYLKSEKYMDEFRKFVEDDNYQKSLVLEPDESRDRLSSSDMKPITPRNKKRCITISPASSPPTFAKARSCEESLSPTKEVSAAHGHRRSISLGTSMVPSGAQSQDKCDPASAECLVGLSVIDTDATPGPRNLIDNSLIRDVRLSSYSDQTSSASSLEPSSPAVSSQHDVHDALLGLNASRDSSASENEEENLLEDQPQCLWVEVGDTAFEIDWTDSVKEGVLKRKSWRKDLFRRSRLPQLHVRKWKSFRVVLAGKFLGFFQCNGDRSSLLGVPHSVVNLDEYSLQEQIITSKPHQFELVNLTAGKHYIMKAASRQDAVDWMECIRKSLGNLRRSQSIPEQLMTFD